MVGLLLKKKNVSVDTSRTQKIKTIRLNTLFRPVIYCIFLCDPEVHQQKTQK